MSKTAIVDDTAMNEQNNRYGEVAGSDSAAIIEGVSRAPITIQTSDGVELSATTYNSHCLDTKQSLGVVVIAAGVGLLQSEYSKYATYLASQGWLVVSFDYRGSGNSILDEKRQFSSCLRDWGKYDLDACIEWADKQKMPRIVLVAHSVGGQLIPFASNHSKIDAIIAVCSQKGYWKFWDGFRRIQLMFLWYFLPVLVKLFGYLPLVLLGRGSNIPAGVASEWGRWGRNRDFVDEQGRSLNFKFADVSSRLLAISFTDDTFFAPMQAVDALNALYVNTELSHWRLSPEVLHCEAIGHSGFFRYPEKLQPLWVRVDSWLNHKSVGLSLVNPLHEEHVSTEIGARQ